MYYPRFTKVIINHFMSKDQSNPRRNKVDWHMAKDDPTLTTMRFIPKHETVQKYDAILPDTLTNHAMRESDAYKTYYDLATRKVIPKPKYVRRSTREKTDQAPKASPGKRLKATAKVAKSGKKKLPTQGLETLSETTFGLGANEGTGVTPWVPDVPTYGSEDEQISWKSSDDEDDDEVSESKDDDDNANNEDDDDQDDDNEQTESDNDSDDFVHPKFSTHDEEEEKLDEEQTNEEEEVNKMYNDVNINLGGRDTKMTDALLANVQTTQVIEDTHVIITAVTREVQQQSSSVSSGFISNMLNLNPDTGIDSILNLNTESTSLVDVPVTMNVEMPPLSVTTLPPPPIPLVQPQQQTPVPTPIIVPSTSLQNLLTFGSLFEFEDRVKALEDDFPEFKQTNLFAEAKSVNEQLEAEVLIRSSNEAKTSHVVVANLSELELKKILIDKMENNKSIDRSVPHKNLYKALVNAYESEKDILASYGDTVMLKRRRDDEDEDEEPSAGSNRGSKRRRARKEPESTNAPKEKTSKSTGMSKKGPNLIKSLLASLLKQRNHYTLTKNWKNPHIRSSIQDLLKINLLMRPLSILIVQPWISTLARNEDPRKSFNELMDNPLDFSAFVLNRLKVDTLTLELLAGLTFELMKGSCKSLVELEYFLEEPLPLIPNSRGHRVIPFDYFITNDLAYLSAGVSSLTYATLVTKTKAADYGHIKWIEDLVPNTMWINGESARDVYSRYRIIGIKKLTIVEWHNYKHLEWITVRRDDDKLYTFKEGD
ncbi:hypothetical protein Tco_1086477 [Tanacetum coccineum]